MVAPGTPSPFHAPPGRLRAESGGPGQGSACGVLGLAQPLSWGTWVWTGPVHEAGPGPEGPGAARGRPLSVLGTNSPCLQSGGDCPHPQSPCPPRPRPLQDPGEPSPGLGRTWGVTRDTGGPGVSPPALPIRNHPAEDAALLQQLHQPHRLPLGGHGGRPEAPQPDPLSQGERVSGPGSPGGGGGCPVLCACPPCCGVEGHVGQLGLDQTQDRGGGRPRSPPGPALVSEVGVLGTDSLPC